jgi:hypothetical protein
MCWFCPALNGRGADLQLACRDGGHGVKYRITCGPVVWVVLGV